MRNRRSSIGLEVLTRRGLVPGLWKCIRKGLVQSFETTSLPSPLFFSFSLFLLPFLLLGYSLVTNSHSLTHSLIPPLWWGLLSWSLLFSRLDVLLWIGPQKWAKLRSQVRFRIFIFVPLAKPLFPCSLVPLFLDHNTCVHMPTHNAHAHEIRSSIRVFAILLSGFSFSIWGIPWSLETCYDFIEWFRSTVTLAEYDV